MKPLTMILAMATDGTIGDKGGIPWNLPADRKRFATLTTGRSVIMGRRTWDSLPDAVRPLPGRRNIVVSRRHPGPLRTHRGAAMVCASVEEAIAEARCTDPEPIIIGGAEIYMVALPLATRILLTEINECPIGDTRLDIDFEIAGWTEVFRQEFAPDGPAPGGAFVELQRVR